MKKDENSLFPGIKGPDPKTTRKILEEEYHKARQQRLLGKRKAKGKKNNLEQPKDASLEKKLQKPEKDLHDYTNHFEFEGDLWNFKPIDLDLREKINGQIKEIAALIDKIKDRKANWSEMDSLRERMLSLVATAFPKKRLMIINPKDEDYYPEKLSNRRDMQIDKAYPFLKKKILKQFFNASINNDPGTTGWLGVSKITLIKGFQKIVKKIN